VRLGETHQRLGRDSAADRKRLEWLVQWLINPKVIFPMSSGGLSDFEVNELIEIVNALRGRRHRVLMG